MDDIPGEWPDGFTKYKLKPVSVLLIDIKKTPTTAAETRGEEQEVRLCFGGVPVWT